MTLTTVGKFTVTGTFRQYNGPPARGYVLITGAPHRIDGPGGRITMLGPWWIPLDRLGKFTVRLPTDSTSGDSTALQYAISVHIRGTDTFTTTLAAKAADTVVDASTPGVVTPLPITGNLPQSIPFNLGGSTGTGGTTPTPTSSNIPQTIPFTIGA